MKWLLTMALLLNGCTMTPWGTGVSTDALGPKDHTPNGLVLILGTEAFASASGRLTNDLLKTWPDGTFFAGETSLSGAAVGLGTLKLSFTEGWLEVAGVEVTPTPQGLVSLIELQAPYVQVRVESGEDLVCETELSFAAWLEYQLSLSHDKYGHIQSALVAETHLTMGDHYPAFTPCDVALGPAIFSDVLGTVGQLLEALIAAELGTVVETHLPSALGVNLAMDLAMDVGGGALGSGQFLARVQGLSSDVTPSWTLSGENLVVPYAVGLGGESHPCVPEASWAIAPGLPLPEALGGVATEFLMNAELAEAALGMAWRSGLLCAERLLGAKTVPVETLRHVWPHLEAFGPEAGLSVRMWPEGEPQVEVYAFQGRALVSVLTGTLRLEVMVAIDDAWVRAATMRVNVAIDGPLQAAQDGSVFLSPTSIDVIAMDAEEGLIRAPSLVVAESVVHTLTTAVLTGEPLFHLPPVATGSSELEVGMRAGYVSFTRTDGIPPTGTGE